MRTRSGVQSATHGPNIRPRRADDAGRRRIPAGAVVVASIGRPSERATAFEALVCVRTGPATSPAQFVAYLADEPTVSQVWRVAADIDVVVRLTCRSLAELEGVVARMRHRGGAEHTVTHLVLPPDIGVEPGSC